MQKLEQTVEDISIKYEDGATISLGDFVKPTSEHSGKYNVSRIKWLQYILPVVLVVIFAAPLFGNGYAMFSTPLFFLAFLFLPILFIVGFILNAKRVIARFKRYSLFADAIGYYAKDLIVLEASGSFRETEVLNAVYSDEDLVDSEVVFGNLLLKNSDEKEIAQQGFVRIKLGRKLPHVLFDTKSHKNGANAHAYAKSQIFEPEGDFNTYFSVYCPKDYERDLLYLFTPEKLQLMMRLGVQYDTELYKEYLYIYTDGPLDYGKTELEALALYASELTKALEKPSARYTDAKSAVPGEIAKNGQRLKNRSGLMLLLFFVMCVAGIILLDDRVRSHLPQNAVSMILALLVLGYIFFSWQLGRRS